MRSLLRTSYDFSQDPEDAIVSAANKSYIMNMTVQLSKGSKLVPLRQPSPVWTVWTLDFSISTSLSGK